MTMLDQMRRHKGWLKWSLGLVVVAFIALYFPEFLPNAATTGTAAPTDVVATVNGRRVQAIDFQRAYTQQVSQLRSAYGDISDQMLRQLGIGQRIVEQLVNQEAILEEAERQGFTVSDGELRERLLRHPAFQENGQFVGEARYLQILSAARPPLRPAEFEAGLRRELLGEKLETAVTGWIRVSDAEVETEYRRRNEKVTLDLAVFTADRFRAGIEPTEAELTAELAARPESYLVPEKRRARYLSIDAEALRSKVTVTPQEIDARYRENLGTYSTPEQVRASHILLMTANKDEAAVRQVAESVLAKAKAGGDFAALARQYSEDEGSKANGGDLDFFGRGAMVKEFEDAAWALQPGEVSDLVQSQFGFHIIKLAERRAASTRSLDEVRPQLENQIRFEKAQAEATRVADEVAKEIKAPADLDRVAAARGFTVGDSGLFAREEPIAGLGFAPEVASAVFSMQPNGVSEMLRTSTGFVFASLVEVKPPYQPALAEVRDRVRENVIRARAVALAASRAATMAQAARTNFAAAARAAGVEVKPAELVTRGTALPEIGVAPKVEDAVFALRAGETSAPITTDNAVVVARVRERQDVEPSALDAQRDTLREEMLRQRRAEFFSAYMQKARAKMTVRYNENTIRVVLGS